MKYIILYFFFYSTLLFAQENHTEIDRNQFDQLLMEEKLLEAVNRYRLENDLPLLIEKQNLNAAAFDQAEYNQKNKKEGHTQEKESMKTTPLRVNHYGGMFYEMGELIYTASLGRAIRVLGEESIRLTTYEEVAKAAVKEWSSNEKINEIINSMDYYSIGVAASINEDKSEISIVSILATAEYQMPSGEKPIDDDYGLKAYQKSDCDVFNRENPFLPELLSDKLIVKNNKVYLKNDDRALLTKILNNSKDGFAIDLVTKNQFDCKNGNALYPSDIHFGWLLKPIKASNLNYKESDGGYKEEIELGELPLEYSSKDLNVNLLVFKNNSVCAYIPENLTLAQNLHWISPEWEIKLPPSKEYLHLIESINLNSDNTEGLKNAIESLASFSSQIDSMFIEINWSPLLNIDSNDLKEKINEYLISSKIKNTSHPISIKIQFNNNWKKIQNFNSNRSIALEIKTLSIDEQIDVLKQQKDSVWNQFIAAIHQTELIYTLKKLKSSVSESELITSYKKSLDLEAHTSALSLQAALIQLAKNGNENAKKALSIEGIKQNKEMLVLISNAAIHLYQIENNKSDAQNEQLRKTFLAMYLIDKNNPLIAYNLCLSTLIQWEKSKIAPIKPDLWLEYFKSASLNNTIEKDKLNQLLTNFYLLAADYYYELGNIKDRKNSLESAYNLIIKSDYTLEENNAFAKYFMFQLQIEFAANILKKQLKIRFDENTARQLISLSSYPSASLSTEEVLQLLDQFYKYSAEKFCKLFSDKHINYLVLNNLELKSKYCQNCD